jgi:hypothetical protein
MRGSGWHITIKVGNIYNGKIEVVSPVIESGKKFTTGVKFEVSVAKFNTIDHAIEKKGTHTFRSTYILEHLYFDFNECSYFLTYEIAWFLFPSVQDILV